MSDTVSLLRRKEGRHWYFQDWRRLCTSVRTYETEAEARAAWQAEEITWDEGPQDRRFEAMKAGFPDY